MRLGDLDALKAILFNDTQYCFWHDSVDGSDVAYTQRDLFKCIDLVPTIDAVPVVRKPVVGYEGYYEVDRFGRVFSLDRVVTVVDGNRTYEKPLSGKQMKQSMHDKGYKTVSLTKDGKTKMMFVHRIVAEAFLPNPDNLPMVNHKDEDKTNNFLENLEWCTAAYNRTYGKAVERQAKKLRGRESEKRVAVVCCTLDGKYEEWFPSIAEAAKIVKGSTSAISKVCKGERKMAYGYKWAYADDFCSYGEKRCDDAT